MDNCADNIFIEYDGYGTICNIVAIRITTVTRALMGHGLP